MKSKNVKAISSANLFQSDNSYKYIYIYINKNIFLLIIVSRISRIYISLMDRLLSQVNNFLEMGMKMQKKMMVNREWRV